MPELVADHRRQITAADAVALAAARRWARWMKKEGAAKEGVDPAGFDSVLALLRDVRPTTNGSTAANAVALASTLRWAKWMRDHGAVEEGIDPVGFDSVLALLDAGPTDADVAPADDPIDSSGAPTDDAAEKTCLVIPDGSPIVWADKAMRTSWGEKHLAGKNGELRHTFVASQKGTDRAGFFADIKPASAYRVRQEIFIEEGFSWGGKQQGGKLGFSLGGGSVPTGGEIKTDGFTARLMWRGDRKGGARLVLYSYTASRDGAYGVDFDFNNAPILVGRWFTVDIEIHMNSAGQADGRALAWMDGRQVLNRSGIAWQGAGDLLIDTLIYSAFHGGNSAEWSPENTSHMRVRNVCYWPIERSVKGTPVTVVANSGKQVPVPATGAYIGMNTGDEANGITVEGREKLLGHKMAIERIFYGNKHWTLDRININQVVQCHTKGRIPMVSYKVGDWKEVTAGKSDAIIDKLARLIKESGIPMLLTFHHEPDEEACANDDPDCGKGQIAQDYVDMWRHIHGRFSALEVDNVSWNWIVMGWQWGPSGRGRDIIEAMFPGVDYVDWMSADLYNMAGGNCSRSPEEINKLWSDLEVRGQGWYDWASQFNKPLALGEWGCFEDKLEKGRKAEWFRNAIKTLRKWDKIKAAVYFDRNHEGCDWRLDVGGEIELQGYRDLINDPYFIKGD